MHTRVGDVQHGVCGTNDSIGDGATSNRNAVDGKRARSAGGVQVVEGGQC